MFKNIFKSKKEKVLEKEENLQEFLKKLQEEYKPYFNCYAFDGKQIVIYLDLKIRENKIILTYRNKDTFEGYESYSDFSYHQMMYGNNFIKTHRLRFLELKRQLNELGVGFINEDNNNINL